jgi:diguanylate cyclase (GGDEF)-like protein/PAS domain S-box-containing protein
MVEIMDTLIMPNLQKITDLLRIRKEEIVDLWVSRRDVREIMERYEVDAPWFTENYGDNIVNTFIKIIQGKQPPGDCPYMNRMVRYLREKDLTVTDVFNFCTGLRRSVRDTVFNPADREAADRIEILDQAELSNEINILFDMNLTGVLRTFQETISIKERQVQEYMDIVDKNVIISKTDLKGILIHVSEAFCEASGYSKKELIGKPHNIVRHSDMPAAFFENLWSTIGNGRIWYGEIKNRRKDGKPYWVEGSVQPLTDREGNLYGYMAIRHDITHTIMMFTDPLTRINNRLKFEECLQMEMSRYIRYRHPFCITLFDIDDFKKVNDTYGHKTGDEVLIGVTAEVKKNTRDADIFARWGGEEFVILSYGTVEETHYLAERLRESIENAVLIPGHPVTCSFGVSLYSSSDTEDSLFIRADEYLYKAKHLGKNRIVSDINISSLT